MCGIAGGQIDGTAGRVACVALAHRGPDYAATRTWGRITLAHTRLAIRDLHERSHQPLTYGTTTVVYNGELWNAEEVRRELREERGLAFHTTGDTEVFAAALDAWGSHALTRLDGMWVIAWYDEADGDLRLATDRYGEVPVHVGQLDGRFVFASEVKALVAMGVTPSATRQLGPGELVTLRGVTPEHGHWSRIEPGPWLTDLPTAADAVAKTLDAAVARRTVSDVPVACLLSGGLDSAATLAMLVERLPEVCAYTAVYDRRSPDLRAARVVAEHLGVELVEVEVPEPTADGLAATVAQIEMPHKAQVEIGWACLALADALRADGVKVVYSGEGSDELWGSYGFSYHGIKADGWYGHRRKLFLGQYRKNFARVNKVFLARGVEPRMPFLDDALVQLALSLPVEAVRDGRRPKAVLERAVAERLPGAILRRAKLAFQDAAGLKAACASAVADPLKFYRAEYRSRYGGAQ